MTAPETTIGINLTDPKGCEHSWQPVSMVFETQLLDDEGRVRIRQPDLKAGRVYLVCLACAQHTYMATNWTGYQLEGSEHRGFAYNPNSSHPYSLDDGATWRPEKPTPEEMADDD
jgi:hypothetical protein